MITYIKRFYTGIYDKLFNNIGDSQNMSKSNFFLVENGVTNEPQEWGGGLGVVAVTADNMNGASVTLEGLFNGKFIAVGAETTFANERLAGFMLPSGTQLRAAVEGAPSNLSVSINRADNRNL